MQNDVVIQQVLDRIEDRTKQFCDMDAPSLTVIAAPVSPDRPMIQPSGIYKLHETSAGVKRVDGGVCIFTEPPDDDPDKLIDLYTELNKYGVVYYRRYLYENSGIPNFIHGINGLLKHAKKLYNACDAPVDIRVHASMTNVFKKELVYGSDIPDSTYLPSKPVCYDSEVCVSTAKTYDSAGFVNINKRPILEELTVPLLWAFNVPIDSDAIIEYVRYLIRQNA